MTERAPPRVYSLTEIAAHLPVPGEEKERTVRRWGSGDTKSRSKGSPTALWG